MDVKQLDAPSKLGFMTRSIPMHNNEMFMETLCFENYDNFLNILNFHGEKMSPKMMHPQLLEGLKCESK